MYFGFCRLVSYICDQCKNDIFLCLQGDGKSRGSDGGIFLPFLPLLLVTDISDLLNGEGKTERDGENSGRERREGKKGRDRQTDRQTDRQKDRMM